MSEGVCQKCRDWHGCVGKEWYNFSEIRWCPFQVLWLLRNADTFHTGKWPAEDNRAESIGSKQFHKEGSFVKPATIIAELEHRLGRCGVQGKLLRAQARAGDSLEDIEPEAWDVLMYVKGYRRKDLPFRAWLKQRRYLNKITTKKYSIVTT